MHNEEAWKWADSVFITTLLCHECHETADRPVVRAEILKKLYMIHGQGNAEKGKAIVSEVFDKITELITISWELP